MMKTKEKIAKIVESNWPIAYDGCHKIYFLEDDGRVLDALEKGYEIFPAKDLPELYENSCMLKFVSRWGYDNSDFEHPLNIPQFTLEQPNV